MSLKDDSRKGLKGKKLPPGCARQMYAWYPVVNGCPNCNEQMHLPLGNLPIEPVNKVTTKCPNCGQGLELVIGKMDGDTFIPADFSDAQPDGDIAMAYKFDGVVIVVDPNTPPVTQA